jgi:PAS domain S-box-containing protein
MRLSIKTKIILFTLFLVLFSTLIIGLWGVRLAVRAETPGQQTLVILLLVGGTFTCVVIVTFLFAYRLIQPVDDLIIGTQLVAEGTLDHEIIKNSDDEIGRLVDSFNRMIMKLRTQTEQSSRFSNLATVEKQKAELIIDSMADGVIVTDSNHKIVLFNPAAEKLFDVTNDKILGRNIVHFLKRFNIHVLFADFPEVRESILPDRRTPIKIRTFEITKPVHKVVRATIAPLRNEGHVIIGTVSVFEDFTKQKELDDMKTEFVSTVSHELRTPLTSIKGYAALMAEGRLGALSEQQQRSINIINSESDRLTALINDILDLSRMEAGKARTNFTFTNIGECIAESPVLHVAQSKGITVSTVIPPNLPKLLVDKTKISQVFTNLLSNAVKFTKPGGAVTIKIQNRRDFVQVDITDTGIGIPKKEIPNLFNKFYQVERHLTRYQGGSGLGLPIVKEIIGLHHGLISIRSVVNKGTTVSFSLPKYPLTEAELVQCWEKKHCTKIKCPAYQDSDRRCWLFIGTRCRKSNEPCLDKIEVCSDCEIYLRGIDGNNTHSG